MTAFTQIHNIEKTLFKQSNAIEYSGFESELKWTSNKKANLLKKQREKIWKSLLNHGCIPDYNNTKIDCSNLSTGCKLCAAGLWSCLFINNKCNINCFYCPAKQNEISIPTTNNLVFENVSDYIDYLETFKFKGCSISGGEPMLTYNKTLNWIKSIKKHFGSKLYLWLYTNGTLLNSDNIKEIADSGLDEIRFDIASTAYNTDKAEMSVPFIPNVTIEIPAIPGDTNKLKNLANKIDSSGIKYLNLHQLRCTNYNIKKLTNKGFSFIHGPKILVSDSENTALKLIEYVKESNFKFGINYCSFVYKNSFQGKATRVRVAQKLVNQHESITNAGYIRALFIKDNHENLEKIENIFKKEKADSSLYKVFPYKNKLYFNIKLAYLINKDFNIGVEYYSNTIFQRISYANYFVEIPINNKIKVSAEKYIILKDCILPKTGKLLLSELPNMASEKDYYNFFKKIENINDISYEEKENLIKIKNFEFLRWGLQDYF